MLPFLKPKKMASVIIQARKKDGATEERVEGESQPKYLERAEKMISAIHAKDAAALADLLENEDISESQDEQ